MTTETGGPAFPCERQKNWTSAGMTLRDYFASKALPICYQFWTNDYYHPDAADAEDRVKEDRGVFDSDTKIVIADCAYEMADAMLERRKV